jgi:hypothetical protein
MTMDRRTFLSQSMRVAGAVAGGSVMAACGGAAHGSTPPSSRRPAPVRRGTRPQLPVGGNIAENDLMPVDELWHLVEEMCSFGPRFTGSHAHNRYLDMLHDRLERYGMHVTRYPVPFDQWLAHRWSLHVVDAHGTKHKIPVAYYRPHSGETSARGVTATVVDVGAASVDDYGRNDVRGKIVLADLALTRLKESVWSAFADSMYPPDVVHDLDNEDFTRIWLGIPPPPSLEVAKQHGAVAMINVLDLSPPLAEGQYSPHQQDYAGLPTLHVDRVQGARLRTLMKSGDVTATLVLDVKRGRTTIDYLGAEVPGAQKRPGSLLVMTHTDGQNAIEENGGPAMLALAEYFTRYSRAARDRDVFFLFSPNHMAAPNSTPRPYEWFKANPDLLARMAMALVPEHLGTVAWDDVTTGTFRSSGKSEFVAVPVGNSTTLKHLAIDEVQRSDLNRSGVLRPRDGGLYGEGTFAYLLGIPTIAYITGPSYLLQVAPGDNLDKLDRNLMHHQTAFLSRVMARMLALPNAVP